VTSPPEAPEVSRAATTAREKKKAAKNIKIALYTRIGRLACIVFEVGKHKDDCGWWWPLHSDAPSCCAGDGFGGLLALFNTIIVGGATKQEFTEAVHATKSTLASSCESAATPGNCTISPLGRPTSLMNQSRRRE
jgi:hypothetical protein